MDKDSLVERLRDLPAGGLVKIKLPHWPTWIFARVLGQGQQHCQRHGDLIGPTVKFRKVKRSGRESHLFDLLHTAPVELLEAASEAEFERQALKETSRG